MEKKSFTALFAVIMVMTLVPFVPSFIEEQFSQQEITAVIRPTVTATQNNRVIQISDYITAGYVGQYGPVTTSTIAFTPQVLGISTSRIGPPSSYRAREVDRSNSIININPGQAVTVWVDFLNTGTATWFNNGHHYLALNVTNPVGRSSVFQHDFWKKNYQPARLLQKEVRPGAIGRFRFVLQAPKTTGIYKEEFNLVAENLTWVDGGYTSWTIGVGVKAPRPPDYQAQEKERSHGNTLNLRPGQGLTFWIDFENKGLKTWYSSGDHFIALNVTDPVGRVSLFKHDFWSEYYYRPTRLMQARIYPGEVGRFRFALQAPNVPGYYTEKFALVAENLTWIPGGEFTVNFKVGDPPATATETNTSNEPIVRIGLYNTSKSVDVTSNGTYDVINMTTGATNTKKANETTTINYSENAYWRLVPTNPQSIMTLVNFENRPVWNAALNDNTFRGNIEIRYSAKTRKMWVINELPVDDYLKGLAEVTNEQPAEYLKTLIIAARSYVIWHHLRGGKHADEYFDINSTTDQVYRGYGFEQRSIDPVLAVQATAGLVITHRNAVTQLNPRGVALAPYSSGTDGRTRSWQEVWDSGGYPWILSVNDPYGVIANWRTLEGNHMVGLSAQGARGYAINEGKTYDWILKHYYNGVNVEKIY